MRNLRHLTMFLASPGDVSSERAHVRSVVDELNRSVAPANGFHIDVVGWDTNARPAFGGDGQAVINDQIADMTEYDLFVGIMWNRFGSPTPRAGSGTEEEFGRALASFNERGTPQIMLYFGQMPAAFEAEEQLAQRSKVLSFRGRVEAQGLTWRYPDPDRFRELFREHLTGWVLAQQSPEPPEATRASQPGPNLVSAAPEARQAPAPAAPAAGDWLLLGDRFFRASSVRERQGDVAVEIVPDGADDDEALRQAVGRRTALRFAYQNQAGTAEVRDGERASAAGHDLWTLALKVQRPEGNFFAESSYNNYSSAQIATMRARLILLDEAPGGGNDAFLAGFVAGYGNSGKVEGGVLPGLWHSLGGDRELFPQLARLLALYYMKSTNTADAVTRLEIGPVENGLARVRFEGFRPKYYTNRDPEPMAVEGVCRLEG